MSRFDELEVNRDPRGRFAPRAAGQPAASLSMGALGQPSTSKAPPPPRLPSTRRLPRTGVVKQSPGAWKASTELEAMDRALTRLEASQARHRRALAGRELARAGVASATIETDGRGGFKITRVMAASNDPVDLDALRDGLARAVPADLPGQVGGSGTGWDDVEQVFGGPRGVKINGRDETGRTRAAYERCVERARQQARRTITALCVEAERQHVRRLDVIDGDVYTQHGSPLYDETGHRARLGDLTDEHLTGVPGTGRDDDGLHVEVSTHLEATDIQVPGQTFMRL